jgi:hypothetical protein
MTLSHSPDGTWDVTDARGLTRRYAADDFDEFLTTSDEDLVHQRVADGWLLLDESLLRGAGPGHEEVRLRPVTGGYGGLQQFRKVPVRVADDLPQFLLGHLKAGAEGVDH